MWFSSVLGIRFYLGIDFLFCFVLSGREVLDIIGVVVFGSKVKKKKRFRHVMVVLCFCRVTFRCCCVLWSLASGTLSVQDGQARPQPRPACRHNAYLRRARSGDLGAAAEESLQDHPDHPGQAPAKGPGVESGEKGGGGGSGDGGGGANEFYPW